jgi:hypothetical protein
VRTDIPLPADSTNRVLKSMKVKLVGHVAHRDLKIRVLCHCENLIERCHFRGRCKWEVNTKMNHR